MYMESCSYNPYSEVDVINKKVDVINKKVDVINKILGFVLDDQQ